MIPLKLRLKNFMCYRDVPDPLALEGIHVACICGDNGHGKSALLDAMTWALWGKARGRGVDDLIHIGESDMEVELEFSNGEDVYRVIRKRKRARGRGSGASVLELQIAGSGGGGQFRPITGNTIAETQAQISQLLRLEYDTFVNSAFLRQGRADEFTLRTPKERKEVLADILDLSYYDTLEELARQKAREREREALQLEHSLAEIGKEVEVGPGLELEVSALLGELERLETEESRQSGVVRELTALKIRIESSVSGLDALRSRLRGLEEDLSRTRSDVVRHKTRLTEYDRLIQDADDLEDRYARFQRAAEAEKEFADGMREHSRLSDQRNRLERQLDAERVQLTTRLERLKAECRALEEKQGRIEVSEERLAESAERLAALDERFLELNEETRRQEEMSVNIRGLESENRNLLEEMKELRKKVDLLGEGLSQCPTCGTSLAEAGVEHVRSALNSEGEQRRRKYDENRSRITGMTSELNKAKSYLQKALSEAEVERRDLQARVVVLERDVREGEEAAGNLMPLLEERESVSELLENGSFNESVRDEIAEVNHRLVVLAYDSDAHQQVSEQVRSLQGADLAWLKLQEARSRSDEARTDLRNAESRIAELDTRIETERQNLQGIEEQAARLPDLARRLREAQSSLDVVGRNLRERRDRLAGLRQRLQNIQDLQERAKAQRGQFGRVTREKGSYEELARAFGKGGVQALIIETVLPEIEDEANRLLSRMTDNRLHVKIETQRERRTRGSIETLDINIADELGARPYEMFSGGEAFRINFALRVAISRLLTRRAGAPLRILFIDEGFGTQDGAGREKLLDTIYSIQEDFDRIIVITHIDELKEAFPVRIQVTKTEQGSFFSVN